MYGKMDRQIMKDKMGLTDEQIDKIVEDQMKRNVECEAMQKKHPEFAPEKLFPNVLPAHWFELKQVRSRNGMGFQTVGGLRVLLSVAPEKDGNVWMHASCSREDRLPSWDDIKEMKDLFVGTQRTAIQVLPPEAEYVNQHPNVLHLWSCLTADVLPDFTRGAGTI